MVSLEMTPDPDKLRHALFLTVGDTWPKRRQWIFCQGTRLKWWMLFIIIASNGITGSSGRDLTGIKTGAQSNTEWALITSLAEVLETQGGPGAANAWYTSSLRVYEFDHTHRVCLREKLRTCVWLRYYRIQWSTYGDHATMGDFGTLGGSRPPR